MSVQHISAFDRILLGLAVVGLGWILCGILGVGLPKGVRRVVQEEGCVMSVRRVSPAFGRILLGLAAVAVSWTICGVLAWGALRLLGGLLAAYMENVR